MRAKRSGQAAKLRRWRWGIMALVLAGLALCLLAALPVQAARNTEKYCFPLDTAAWRISDAYGARTDPFTGKPAFHSGLDLACAEGTAVRAVQGGVVTAAAYSPSYGNHLRVLHPDGCETRYAHLQYLYVRTCIWNCGSRALPATPPLCWRMPLEPGAGGEAGIPGSGAAVRRGVPAALL